MSLITLEPSDEVELRAVLKLVDEYLVKGEADSQDALDDLSDRLSRLRLLLFEEQ